MDIGAHKSLEELLREWSDGNDSSYAYWINELSGPPHFITSVRDLKNGLSLDNKINTVLANKIEMRKRNLDNLDSKFMIFLYDFLYFDKVMQS
jgi:hypothetical protein